MSKESKQLAAKTYYLKFENKKLIKILKAKKKSKINIKDLIC